MSRMLKELEQGHIGQLRVAEAAVYYDDGAADPDGELICTVPAGCRYRVVPRIKTAFDAGTNAITVGTIAVEDAVLADAVVLPEATGLKAASSWFFAAAETAIYAFYTTGVSDPTEGEARFFTEVIQQAV